MREINTFEDMIQFIRENNLSKQQIEQLVRVCTKSIFIDVPDNKEDTIQILVSYWNKWKDAKEQPIFIDAPDIGNRT